MEMVMGGIEVVLREGERGMHSGRQDLGSAPRWEGPMDCQVERPGCPHLYPALPDTRENTSRNRGLSLDPVGLRFNPGLRMQRPHSHLGLLIQGPPGELVQKETYLDLGLTPRESAPKVWVGAQASVFS